MLRSAVIWLAFALSILTGVPPCHSEPLDDAAEAARQKDYPRAAEIWRQLSEQGDITATTKLGQLYIMGLGVPKDQPLGATLLKRAAETGNVEAQAWLADCYVYGRGVPRNSALAIHWYERAANAGDQTSMMVLGALYSGEEDVPQDLVLAYKWYDLAVRAGSKTPAGEISAISRRRVLEDMTVEQKAAAEMAVQDWYAR